MGTPSNNPQGPILNNPDPVHPPKAAPKKKAKSSAKRPATPSKSKH